MTDKAFERQIIQSNGESGQNAEQTQIPVICGKKKTDIMT